MYEAASWSTVGEGDHDDVALARAARDDIAAFGALYQRYHGRVYRYLRTHVRCDEDAEDLLQQVFLRAFDALPRYHPRKGTFTSWLFRIARNAAIDFQRRHHDTLTWDAMPEALHPRSDDDLDARMAHQESLGRLRHLLATLPADKREILALRFSGELTLPEIGAVIGKSEEATRKQLTRTLQMLEERYDDDTA